jgi:hypothetical protein
MLIGFDLFFDIHCPDVHAIGGNAFDAREGGFFDGVGNGGWVGHLARSYDLLKGTPRNYGAASSFGSTFGVRAWLFLGPTIGLPRANDPIEDGVVDVGVGREADAAQENPAAALDDEGEVSNIKFKNCSGIYSGTVFLAIISYARTTHNTLIPRIIRYLFATACKS